MAHADVGAVGSDGVEDRAGAKVYDNDRAAMHAVGGRGVGHPVGAHVAGVVVEHTDPCPSAGANHQRLDPEERARHVLEDACQRRHHAAHRHLPHPLGRHVLHGQEALKLQGVLVGHAPGCRWPCASSPAGARHRRPRR